MINIQTLDRKIWRKDLLLVYLHECKNANTPAIIGVYPEGPCATAIGLYKLLDEFCILTNYPKKWITIQTGNLIESHSDYIISKQPTAWYEVKKINRWLLDKEFLVTHTPVKHFSSFIGRGNWARLWIATLLDKKYSNKSLQTYHYNPARENFNANGYIGIDDLFQFGCPIITDAVKFIQSCPKTIDIDYLQNLENSKGSIYQHEDSYYPIQHPSNLNLLQYYQDIFVDIVSETTFSGESFFVTEKTWRPIVARRPFIVMSNRDFLANLKKLGFKTFNSWWDEDYDGYSQQHRIKLIEQIIDTIANWTIEELSTKLLEMQDILDHNYKTFTKLTFDSIAEKLKI